MHFLSPWGNCTHLLDDDSVYIGLNLTPEWASILLDACEHAEIERPEDLVESVLVAHLAAYRIGTAPSVLSQDEFFQT